MSELSIILLGPGAGYSGRAVKLQKMLPISVKDEILAAAATASGEDVRKFVAIRMREGALRMIRAVTKPGLKTMDEVRAVPASEWIQVGQGELDGDPSSSKHYMKLFTSKDFDVLGEVYRRANDATNTEVETILGGELLVSEA